MAARFFVAGGTNTNFNSSPVTNWAATSGGAGNQSVPGASDDVTFDGAGAGNSACIISATVTVLSLTISGSYTSTITHNAVMTIAGNVTFKTGYTIAGSSNITISAASTITSNSKTWPNGVTFSGANIKTLSGDWTISGILIMAGGASGTLNKTANETLSCAGWTVTGSLAGNANVTLTGGTWSGAGTNTMTGTITFAGSSTVSSPNINGSTLVYSSGTITTTGGTLTINGSSTLNTNNVSWNNVTISATCTVTINSLLSATLLTITAGFSVTFAGTTGFTVGTFTCSNATGQTHTFVHAVTYTITTALNALLSPHTLNFTSDDGTVKAILTLNNGATCNVSANFTRMDASNGRAIWSYNGTITTCNNIFAFTDIGVIQFVNKTQATGVY